MKLYIAPFACSLSPHIVAREAGLDFELIKVDGATKRTHTGEDYRAINPKGYVPALQLDDGSVLTEGPAIVQYLADRAPQSGLAPANGTLARYRLQEALNFLSTEIHKAWSPLWNKGLDPAVHALARQKLDQRFRDLEATFAAGPYLLGETFTAADAYLFTLLNWAQWTAVDLTPYPWLTAFQARVAARPAVQAAIAAENAAKRL